MTMDDIKLRIDRVSGELSDSQGPYYCWRSHQRVCSTRCVACLVNYGQRDDGEAIPTKVKFCCLVNTPEIAVRQ